MSETTRPSPLVSRVFPVGTISFAVGCLAAAAGCGSETDPPSATYQTRDSAGIAILENSGVPASRERWSVDAEPLLSIGGADGPPPAMFTVVTSASRLRDGTIVVLENSTSELRFFDSGGAHLRTAGGFGEGPGEFERGVSFVRMPGDTLLLDAATRHLVFSPAGEYIRQTPIDFVRHFSGERGVACTAYRLLADGSFLACEALPGDSPGGHEPPPTARFIRVAPDGTETVLGHYWDRRGLFLASTWFASGGSPPAVAIAPNPEYSIEVWSLDGELTRIIRRLDARRPPTDAEVAAAVAELEARQMIPQQFGVDPPESDAEPPALLPAVVGMTVGVSGDVWVRRNAFGPMIDETIFDVFDGEGRFRGEVRFEGYFWLYEVGEDYVLGARLDEMGVAHVQLHRLSRGDGGRTDDALDAAAALMEPGGAHQADRDVAKFAAELVANVPQESGDDPVAGCCFDEEGWGWPVFKHIIYPSPSCDCPPSGTCRSLAPTRKGHTDARPGTCRWGPWGGHHSCIPLVAALLKIDEQDEMGLVAMALQGGEASRVVRLAEDGAAVELHSCSGDVLIVDHTLVDPSAIQRARSARQVKSAQQGG